MDRHSATLARQGKAARASQGGILALTGTITGLGAAQTAASRKASYFARGLAAVNLATGPLEAGVSALIGSTMSLASGLTAAGIGLGAYGVAAKGVVSQLATLAQAQKTAFAPGATKEAVAKYREELARLSPPLRDFWTQLQGVRKDYEGWSRSLQKPVLAPMSAALRLVHPLLRDMAPFVREASDAMTTLIDQLGRGIRSTGFHEWLATMLPLVKPTILGIGRAIGNIAVGLGGVLRAFAPFSSQVITGLQNMTARFREWGTTLSSHTGFQSLIAMWKQNWPVMREGLGKLVTILANIGRNMAGMLTPANSRLMWQIANPLLSLAARLSANPALMQTFLYLLLIGKGAGQIRGVFDSLKAGWGGLSRVIGWLSGGKINLGMQGAGNTMLLASQNMQRAANTMLGAGKGGAPGAVAGAGKGPAAVKKGGVLGFLGSFFGSALTAAGIALVATQIIGAAVPQTRAGLKRYERDTPGAVQGFLDFMFGGHVQANSVAQGLRKLFGPAADWGPGEVFRWLFTGKGPNDPANIARNAGQRAGQAFRSGITGAMAGVPQALGPVMTQIGQQLQGLDAIPAAFRKQSAAARAATPDLNNYSAAIRRNGVSSAQAHAARYILVNDLMRAGVNSQTANRHVDAYTSAVRRNGVNSAAAHAARQVLVSDIARAVGNSRAGRADMDAYTNAVSRHGVRSDQARGARRRLINDLVAAGLDARTARNWVNSLSTAITGLPKPRVIIIQAHGSGKTTFQVGTTGRKGWATGGRLPGFGGGDRIPAMLEAGETVVDKHRTRTYAPVFRAMGVPGFAAGGVISRYGQVRGTYRGRPAPMGSWMVAQEQRVQDMAGAQIKSVIETILAQLRQQQATSGVGAPGGGVMRWAGVVRQALGLLGQSLGWTNAVLTRIRNESGGNPYIVNKWDSNWAAGHPSVGLMQVIGPTFRAYAGRFRNTGPFSYGVSVNPLANIYAGLRYAIARYGGLGVMTRPGGYGNGGPIEEAIAGLGMRTGRPYQFHAGEQVQTAAQGRSEERLLRDILRELRALNATAGKAPARTAVGVARATAGPPHLAAANARLGAR